jgi:hypothetical protein
MTLDDARSLIEAPSPAVLTTYRKDGSALTSPVWFRFHRGAFEVVLAEFIQRLPPLIESRAESRVA